MTHPVPRRRRYGHAATTAPLAARRARLAAVLSSAALIVVHTLGAGTPPATAIYAAPDGGSGQYAEVIDWIDWTEMTGAELDTDGRTRRIAADGGTVTVWSTPTKLVEGQWRSSQCTISEVETHFESVDPSGKNPPINADAGLRLGYVPGSWVGDGLARLYNDSSRYDNGVEIQPGWLDQSVNYKTKNVRSNLPIGISNVQGGKYGNSANAYFKFDCTTYAIESASKPAKSALDGLPKKQIPMVGMVYADAEASNWMPGSRESITVDAIPMEGKSKRDVTFRLMESTRSPGCTTSSWGGETTFPYPSGARTGLQLRPDGYECATWAVRNVGHGPSSVFFMENADGGYVEIKGGGVSAMALGVVTYVDHGDAPASYGEAASLFQPTWWGGKPGGTDTTDISSSPAPPEASGTWYNFTDAQAQGYVAEASAPRLRLGKRVDAEPDSPISADATGDDVVGSRNDEDAIGTANSPGLTAETYIGADWSTTFTCAGAGATVVGWIDWNRNGVFDDGERSSMNPDGSPTTCDGSKATLTWKVPADAKRSVPGEAGSASTFARLRITDDRNPDGSPVIPGPTGLTLNGEVEDHGNITVLLPTLTLKKNVVNDSANGAGIEADQWTLTASQGGGELLSGAGQAAETPIPVGEVNLAEASTNSVAGGYSSSAWTCSSTDGAADYSSTVASQEGTGTGTLTVNNHDRITCEITNSAQAGAVTWTKTEADGATPLGGATFTLTRTRTDGSDEQTFEVADCVGTCEETSLDQDGRAGYFRLTALWGDYTIVESAAPKGYVKSDEQKTGTLDYRSPRADGTLSLDLGTVTNTRALGAVIWSKTDAATGEALADSQWELTADDIPAGTLISDCVDGDCAAQANGATYFDADPRPGYFKVRGLPADDAVTRAVTEHRAPAGYTLDTAPHEFTITVAADGTPQDHAFPGAFTNAKSPVPTLPLTGGMGADMFYIGGGVLGALAILAGIVRHKRR